MCNSFEARSNYREFVDAMKATRRPLVAPPPERAPNLEPQPLVRPTDRAPVICAAEGEDGAALRLLRWGFPPPPGRRGGPVINFRSEGRRFGPGRCIAPASAFFEYTGERSPKTRWRVTLEGEDWFGMAGWTRPTPQLGAEDDTRFTLLTCAPGPDISVVHDRQMVVLRPADFADWLDPAVDPARFMQPLPAGSLRIERG